MRPSNATNITLKRKVGYNEEDEEVYQTRRWFVKLAVTESLSMEQ